jgi:hypothetical protein
MKSLKAHRGEDDAEEALDGNLSGFCAWEEKISSNRSEPELDLNLGPGSWFSKLREPDPKSREFLGAELDRTGPRQH